MIVVVGRPILVAGDGARSARAGGHAVAIARAAARAGGVVQFAGKVGTDAGGDSVLLDLAEADIGHVAVLRDPSGTTPTAASEDARGHDPGARADEGASILADDAPDAAPADPAPGSGRPFLEGAGTALEPADLDLALRYLSAFSVLVLVDTVDPAVIAIATEAAAYVGARLIVITAGGDVPTTGLQDATVLESPPADPDDAFAGLVGRYAVALDHGEPPDAAFRIALGDGAWETVTAD